MFNQRVTSVSIRLKNQCGYSDYSIPFKIVFNEREETKPNKNKSTYIYVASVIGSIVFLIACLILIWFVYFKRKRKSNFFNKKRDQNFEEFSFIRIKEKFRY